MSATVIDGKAIAQKLLQSLKLEVSELPRPPGLHVILIGNNPASEIYVRHKTQACAEVGIQSTLHNLPDHTTEKELVNLIESLNADPLVDGILVQLPLPATIPSDNILEKILPSKDVDGFHPYNLGRLAQRRPQLRPCTPYGVIHLLHESGVELQGKHAVVVGASNIVGRPMMLELLLEGATVTLCHRFTQHLPQLVKQADILIVAIGRPEFIPGSWLKPGAVVIDVGMNRLSDGKLVGDIDFSTAVKQASLITPVPGGVGPMTVAMLMLNTVLAHKLRD